MSGSAFRCGLLQGRLDLDGRLRARPPPLPVLVGGHPHADCGVLERRSHQVGGEAVCPGEVDRNTDPSL